MDFVLDSFDFEWKLVAALVHTNINSDSIA
jgi:hypothetical protein